MKELRAVQRVGGTRVVGWAVGLSVALGFAVPLYAEPPLPRFGMIGLAEGQSAVLTLVLTEAVDNLDCVVRGAFLNAQGQVFQDSLGHEAVKDFTLQPGVADTLRLRATDVLAGQPRILIRAALTAVPNDLTESDCTYLIANTEIVNSNGQTSFIYPPPPMPPRDGSNPPPSR